MAISMPGRTAAGAGAERRALRSTRLPRFARNDSWGRSQRQRGWPAIAGSSAAIARALLRPVIARPKAVAIPMPGRTAAGAGRSTAVGCGHRDCRASLAMTAWGARHRWFIGCYCAGASKVCHCEGASNVCHCEAEGRGNLDAWANGRRGGGGAPRVAVNEIAALRSQ